MRRETLLLFAALLAIMASVTAAAADGNRRTVVYDGAVYEVGGSFSDSKDLWLTLKDLTRITKFVLKPQGMCRGELCFPIPKGRTKEFIHELMKPKRTAWFNLSEFARLIHQPIAYDEPQSVWYFGPRSEDHDGYIASLEAPDFSMPDWKFQPHSLSEFRGKKVLLITWASW